MNNPNNDYVIIQCAGNKNEDAGGFEHNNKKVVFVATPTKDSDTEFTPDSVIPGTNTTWRDYLVQYNTNYLNTGNNPLNLYKAMDLYGNHSYRSLVEHYGENNVYILSAGWGIIRANYLLPLYDITFCTGKNVKENAIREDYTFNTWKDFDYFCPIIGADMGIVNILCGKSYRDFLNKLIRKNSEKWCNTNICYYFNDNGPEPTPPISWKGKWESKNYGVMTGSYAKTNWHYGCAKFLTTGLI